MTDVRHRDVWRVWFHIYLGFDKTSSDYAHFVYAINEDDAIQRASRQLRKMMPEDQITIVSAEKR